MIVKGSRSKNRRTFYEEANFHHAYRSSHRRGADRRLCRGRSRDHGGAQSPSRCRRRKEVQMEAYVINGNNYVKLRDMGKAVGFEVYWDSVNGCVQVESNKPYTGEAPAKAEPDKPESHPEPAVPANDADVDAMKQDIVDRTNALRKENGIAALTADDKLMQAAQVRAEEMAASGVYSHIRPDGRKYMTVTDSQYIGENIHCLEDWALKEKSLPETVMWAWSASAGHLKNMTNSRYGSIGVGLAKGTDENGEDCWYCVQLFMDTGCSISWVDRPAAKQ